jgi:hypothetical protein
VANGYALGQLGQALLTAATHEDAEARSRADRRAQQWAQTIQEMAAGRVRLGSRVPVRGLPEWVTLDVLRGGFATGKAAAETPLAADEIALAHRLDMAPSRRLIFGHFLTDAGLAELWELLDSGAYRVEIPEDAALLTVAWLVRAGDRNGALDVLDAIAPFAGRFRLMPKEAPASTLPDQLVYRITAGEAAGLLRARKPKPQVEAQREALSVWNPLLDRVLALWLELDHGSVREIDLDPRWLSQAQALVDEYDRLSMAQTRCSKHRNRKENLAILVASMRSVVAGVELTPRQAGQLRVAIAGCVAKRGRPGSAAHGALRQAQHASASAPAYPQLAAVAAARLAALRPDEGIVNPEGFSGAVTGPEAAATGVAAGWPMPFAVPAILGRAHAADVETLLDRGTVPSAEVLAELTPRLSAATVSSAFADPALGRLAGADYQAFRRRRSLLLSDLDKQVQWEELPWARAACPHSHGQAAGDIAVAAARRVGALALDHFPATIIPNPLVQELKYLFQAGDQTLPLVEELAADIFTGHFSDKFRLAAQVAAKVVDGTLYARYYGIDAKQLLGLPMPAAPGGPREPGGPARPGGPGEVEAGAEGHVGCGRKAAGPGFAELCRARAGLRPADSWSVAANGAVIEQAQILTTHNLAVLVASGVHPARPWVDLARESIGRVAALLALAARRLLAHPDTPDITSGAAAPAKHHIRRARTSTPPTRPDKPNIRPDRPNNRASHPARTRR